MKMNAGTMFGLAAIIGLLAVTAPAGRAEAMSPVNPGISSAAKQASETLTTDVHWRRHHRHRWHRHHGWRGHHGWHRRHHGWRGHHRWHGHRHWYRRYWS